MYWMYREQVNDYRRIIRLVKINGPSIGRLLIRSELTKPHVISYEDIQYKTRQYMIYRTIFKVIKF